MVFQAVDCIRDFEKRRRGIVGVGRFRGRWEFEVFRIDFGIRVEEFRKMFAPPLKFFLGGFESIAVAVVEIFGGTDTRATKLVELRVSRSEMVARHIYIELASYVAPRLFVALAGLIFASIFKCLEGFLEMRVLGVMPQILFSCCLVVNKLLKCWGYPRAWRVTGKSACFEGRREYCIFESCPQLLWGG